MLSHCYKIIKTLLLLLNRSVTVEGRKMIFKIFLRQKGMEQGARNLLLETM